MTLRSRLTFGLLAVLVVVALPSISFAQVSITLTPNVSAAEIQTNRNAQTATAGSNGAGVLISGQLIANSALSATTLTLTYPAPITSGPAVLTGPGTATNVPSADPIKIEGATGLFDSITGILTVNYSAGTIQIVLPASSANSQSGSFRLVGVRIDANGKTAPLSFFASLSSATNNYIMVTSSGPIINSLSPGIASMAIGATDTNTNYQTATVLTNGNVSDDKASFVITEGFATAWRSPAQSSNSGSSAGLNGTEIRLTATGIPSGVTLTLALTPSSTLGAALSGATLTSTTPTQNITFSSTSLSTTEKIYVLVTVSASTTAVITPGTITINATNAPIGDALDASGTPTATGGYPRFVEANIGTVTVVNLVAANTTMLLTYALVFPPFDTGIAIANTTADPFGTQGGATPTAGTLTFQCYPTPGTRASLTTSPTIKPGSGLDADGNLAAGRTWTGLLSQVLSMAGYTGSFVGYCFIQTNFLNAHGTATISDFKTYSLASNVLVLPPPATADRNTPGSGVEALGF